MYINTMTCPSCKVSQLELRTINGRDVYACFVCDWKESAAVINDAQRWWGAAHLPFIDIFCDPPAAFRQLGEHPTILPLLLFLLASWWIELHVAGNVLNQRWDKLVQHIAVLGKPRFLPIFGFIFLFLQATLQALFLNFTATFFSKNNVLSGSVSLKGLWAVNLFLVSLSGLLLTPLHSYRIGPWGIAAWSWIWLIWAIHELYRIDFLESLIAWAVAKVIPWILFSAVVIGGALIVSKNPALLQKLLHKPTWQPLHAAMNYDWQVKDLQGNVLSIKDLKGKVIFLNFWATSSGPCRVEMSSIQKLSEQLKNDKDIVFLCVTQEPINQVWGFVNKLKARVPIYVAEGFVPIIFQILALPTTYLISPHGQVVAKQIGASNWDTPESVQLLENLANSNATALPQIGGHLSIPPLAHGEIDIKIQPMVNLNFKPKQEILDTRTAEIHKYPILAPANYEPDPAIFQIVDKKPWWGIAGLYFYGDGEKSIQGPSEQSRFILNPYLLVGLRDLHAFRTQAEPPEGEDYGVQPGALLWQPAEHKATAYYDLSHSFGAVGGYVAMQPERRDFCLMAYNARDFGFHYLAIDARKTSRIELIAPSAQPIPIQAHIHLGTSCHYPGGCNNASPLQSELAIKTKELPAHLTIHLWRNLPHNIADKPDMTFELQME